MYASMYRNLAHDIVNGTVAGFTVGEHDQQVPTSGFAVGGDPDCPEVRIASVATASEDLVSGFMATYSIATGENWMGGWVHEGDLYLDAPTIMLELDDALRLAGERGELAIFDLENGREILLADQPA